MKVVAHTKKAHERKTVIEISMLVAQSSAGLQSSSETVLHLQWVHNPSTYHLSSVLTVGKIWCSNLKGRGRLCCGGVS